MVVKKGDLLTYIGKKRSIVYVIEIIDSKPLTGNTSRGTSVKE